MDQITAALERRKCALDAHWFIFESGYLKTKDEHDIERPVKSVPDLPYLRVLLDLLLVGGGIISPEAAVYALREGFSADYLKFLRESSILFIEKSRDLFITNIVSCYLHWRAKFRDHQLILVQSKNEDDAANLVYNKDPDRARISFQESHLPEHLRTLDWGKGGSYCNLFWPNGSRCRAIPEGARVIRSEHPSVVFSDEAAFQDEFGGSFTAALPAVQGGGFYLAVSSANPGEFQVLVDPDAPREGTNIPGLTYRIASGSTPVVRVHYASHPERRPGTPAGEHWLEATSRNYPGGLEDPRWRKEQEIDYFALSGQKLFPHWELWQREGNIVIQPFDANSHRLYGSYDYGYRHKSAYLVHAIDADGNITTVWEFAAELVEVPYIAEIVQGKDVYLPDGRHFEGNPYAGKEKLKIADPSIWAKDQPMLDRTQKSIADIFLRYGVNFHKGERGGDTTVANWLLGHFWKDRNKPTYRITANCVNLIREVGLQRFKEFSPKVALNRTQPEELVDKDNDSWDALKMFLRRFPPAMQAPPKPKQPGTFDWWKKVSQGKAQGTFSIGRIPIG